MNSIRHTTGNALGLTNTPTCTHTTQPRNKADEQHTTAHCPIYRDCSQTEPGHHDHHGHDLKILDDTDGTTILDAGMVADSRSDHHAVVYLRNAEFTNPESVRAKTAALRAFLDAVDAMADRVFTDRTAHATA